MLKLIAILPVIILLSGCHTSYELGTRRYQVTDDFSDAQFAVMQAEVDKLCELTDDCISITRGEHWNKIYVGRISSECSEIGGCYAEFTDGSRELSITPESIEMGHLAQTFRHESGHAAGCYGPDEGNLVEPGNVMFGRIEDIAWTDKDLELRGGCTVTGLEIFGCKFKSTDAWYDPGFGKPVEYVRHECEFGSFKFIIMTYVDCSFGILRSGTIEIRCPPPAGYAGDPVSDAEVVAHLEMEAKRIMGENLRTANWGTQ